jgi:mono/diheme cytochrome c family protein
VNAEIRKNRRWWMAISILVLLGAGGVLLALLRDGGAGGRVRNSRFARGRAVAERLGCFACHGVDGARGVATFAPELDEVPTWEFATFSRFVESRAEIREWIIDGMPARMRASKDEQDRVALQLIRMPAYRGHLDEAQLADLIFYVEAVAHADPPEEGTPARRGLELASTVGCFGCHGPDGRLAQPNPGSFQGYIPPWDSEDFLELVRSPDEFQEWVLDGAPRRLKSHLLASRFLESQVVKMPAYRGHLSNAQVADLAAYVDWLRSRSAEQRMEVGNR